MTVLPVAAREPQPDLAGLHLYTDSSPNGFKITIALEELGLPYTLHHVRIEQGEHREPAFLALNPHGRIPVLVDETAGVTLFESAAILLYLAQRSGQLLPPDPQARWQAVQWLMFHSASVGPILGQRVHFECGEGKDQPAAALRYRGLSEQALAVVDGALASGGPYLGGEVYSIADIAHFGWLHIAAIVGFDFSSLPHLQAWFQRVAARPAVQRGIAIPAAATGA